MGPWESTVSIMEVFAGSINNSLFKVLITEVSDQLDTVVEKGVGKRN